MEVGKDWEQKERRREEEEEGRFRTAVGQRWGSGAQQQLKQQHPWSARCLAPTALGPRRATALPIASTRSQRGPRADRARV